jgi:DNA-binding response OmpR family regulator
LLRVSIVADELRLAEKLSAELADRDVNCSVVLDAEMVSRKAPGQSVDLMLIAMNGSPDCSGARYLAHRGEDERLPPVIALVSAETLDILDPATPIDDFVVEPWDPNEVALRVKRTLRRMKGIGRGESIECGDLVIDLDNCEATLLGRPVTLTFKEYQLLKFLAGNRGRVFTRDALLDRVWGYDYYGGDRTVDVHVRRLRSKIEDSTHTFIETVRNIGYRFRKDA